MHWPQILVTISLTVWLVLAGWVPLVQAATIPPNENLVVEGIPPIPVDLETEVKRYTEFRGASLASWHPQRQEMLISTRFCNTSQVHRLRSPLGARTQLTFFSERPSGATYQPTDGNYFVFSRDVGGSEFFQNYRYDLSSGESTLLTDGKSRNSRGLWSNAGDRMVYTSTRRTGSTSDFYLIDPRNPSSDRLLAAVETSGWGPADWSPDDRQLVVSEFVSANESYLWLLDAQTGRKTLLTPKGGKEKVSYSGALFSKTHNGLYVVSDRGSEFEHLLFYDFERRQFKDLTPNLTWDVEDYALSDDGKRLAFITNEDGISILHMLDTTSQREVPAAKFPPGLILIPTWHRNNRDLGVTTVSARSTADIYAIDTTTNRLTRWTESETGGLNLDTFADAELVRWKSFDNKAISGFLYRPPAKFTGKRPVIIDIHGGPESQSRPVFQGRDNYLINELGVALLFPNVRGSAGYGKTFLTLDNGFLREDSVKDIGALLDWIATQPDLDADRVLVTGGSYGGYMALAVATKYGDRIRGAIDIVGISNFVSFLERTEDYRRDLRRVEYGDERDPKMREFLLKISPLTNADKITKPLFVIHGKNDPRVPLNEAEQIVKTVRNNGVPVWYLMAKDEGHGFAKKPNADFQFYATVLFIREYLLK
jgi:dipeptidyl aminopeptidase/acylaminoacyl peptidase